MNNAPLDENPDAPESVTDEYRDQFKKPRVPDDFKTEQEFLTWAIKLFTDDVDNDRDNREQAIEDSQFLAGDQWEERVLNKRVADRKPTLILNRLPAFVGQLVGNRVFNEIQVKIIPEDGSDKEVARIREGLIRNIQKNTRAVYAYNKAYENQVITGMGSFKVELDFTSDDVFEQDIRVTALPNPFGTVWDRMSHEPTGEDARHVFLVDSMTKNDFQKEYPDANGTSITNIRDYLTGQGIDQDWYENDAFRVLEFWRMRSEKRTLALLQSDTGEPGETQVEDITDIPFEDIADRVVTDKNGFPITREADRKFAEMYIITATDILEGPYRLPIDRLPVVRVRGWEVNVGEKPIRFGLIRFMKDPQRLLNYWRSVVAEKLMVTPKGNWVASDKAVEGREKQWRDSHISNNPLLIYNAETGTPPERVPPAQLEAALIQEAGMASQDLHDISNLHQANLGQTSNEVSGRAITARLQVGELGTAIYENNLQMGIEAAGRIMNQLIPVAYDTPRTVKIMGEDGKDISPILINDTTDEASVDITLGKYSVISVAGPSFTSKRQEAAESMLNMVNAAPQALAVALDKIIENQDWPGAEEIAARLRTQLPPGVVSMEDMTPEEQAAQQAAQAAQQQQQQREDAALVANIREREARARQAEGQAQQAIANAAKAFSEVGVKAVELAAKIEDQNVKQFLEAVATFQEATREDTTERET